jgi:hypothetical protein
MLAARITLPHFSVSSAMSLPKAAPGRLSAARGRALRGAHDQGPRALRLYGEAASPFEAWLARDADGPRWATRSLVDADGTRVATLLNEGLSLREVAAESGLSKSAVHRLKRRMEEAAGRRADADPDRPQDD